MKRLLVGVVCALTGLAVLPAFASADVEPNEGITQAEGPLAGGVTYTGTLANSTDLDTYFFYVNGQQQLDINVTATSGSECVGARLGDADNNYINERSYLSSGSSYDFKYSTPPGVNRYYLEFHRGCSSGSTYSFTINPAAGIVGGVPTLVPNPTTEPNENAGEAFGPLTGGVAYAGEIQTQNDQDWFKFYTAPGIHQVDVAFTETSDCETYVGLQAPVEREDDSTYLSTDEWRHFTVTSSGQGVYYLKVTGCVGSRYEFVVQPPEALWQTPPPAPTPAPAPAPSPPPSPAPKVHRGYAIATPSAKVERGEAYVELTCAGAGDCAGTVNLVVRANGSSDSKVSIGSGSFALANGTSTTLPVAVSRLGLGMLHLSANGQLHVHLSGHDLKGGSLLLRATEHRRKWHRHPHRHHHHHRHR